MTKSVDLIVYRAYPYKGVNIIVRLDFLHEKISIVERNQGAIDGFANKEFIFADREAKFMNGWRLILQAMDNAIVEAKKEMEAAKERDFQKMLNQAVALAQISDDRLKEKK